MIKVPKYTWAIASLTIVGDERGGDVQLAARQTSGTNRMKSNTCNGELAVFDSLQVGSAGILFRLDFMVSHNGELYFVGGLRQPIFLELLAATRLSRLASSSPLESTGDVEK